MDHSEFATILRRAIIGTLSEFFRETPHESPYSFALMLGQNGNYLGYAIATEEGLERVAAIYDLKGYRYQGTGDFNNREQLALWLRWSSPDDGWQHGDFHERFQVAENLARMVQSQAFGPNAARLEEFCTSVLISLLDGSAWQKMVWKHPIIVGVTSGSNPRDIVRTATRANDFEAVRRLWAEYSLSEELSNKILSPKSRKA